jgi:hypothetical protein
MCSAGSPSPFFLESRSVLVPLTTPHHLNLIAPDDDMDHARHDGMADPRRIHEKGIVLQRIAHDKRNKRKENPTT